MESETILLFLSNGMTFFHLGKQNKPSLDITLSLIRIMSYFFLFLSSLPKKRSDILLGIVFRVF